MATVQHACYVAQCDECKNDYENDDQVTMHYPSAEEAINVAETDGWQTFDNRLICSQCAPALVVAAASPAA
jgi:hypothetical protein